MTTKSKSTEKKEAQQVVEPKEASKLAPTKVATENDIDVNKPNDNKKVDPAKIVTPDNEVGEPKIENPDTHRKTPQEYQHDKDFKQVVDGGIKEIVVDKEKLQIVPHELTGEPVFETAAEYQKYLGNK